MKNIMQMMQKAQEMQSKMENLKNEIKSQEFVGSSGGGLVSLTMNGDYQITNINIDDSLIEKEEKIILTDLIIAAYNDVRRKVEETTNEKMQELTAGLPIPPGMKLPF